jgi:hypothetical protein
MVTKALQDKCEYIFFLDSDILVNPDTLTRLFIANMPIISAVYYSRAPPYEMVAQIGGRGLSHELAGKDEVREVEEVGKGCCLVNTRVFHRIGQKPDWQCFFDAPQRERERGGVLHMEYEKAKSLNFACDELTIRKAYPPVCPSSSVKGSPPTHTPLDGQSSSRGLFVPPRIMRRRTEGPGGSFPVSLRIVTSRVFVLFWSLSQLRL